MVGSETVMTATTASWAFWIVGALLFVAGVLVLAQS